MVMYRHNNGIISCGTLRIAKADFDTQPSDEIKKNHLDNLCNSGNKIQALKAENQRLRDELSQAKRIGGLLYDNVQSAYHHASMVGSFGSQPNRFKNDHLEMARLILEGCIQDPLNHALFSKQALDKQEE